jgi:hypothetical protein
MSISMIRAQRKIALRNVAKAHARVSRFDAATQLGIDANYSDNVAAPRYYDVFEAFLGRMLTQEGRARPRSQPIPRDPPRSGPLLFMINFDAL